MSHTWLAKLIGCVTLSVVLSAGGLSTRATVPTTATTSGLASHRIAARATLSLSARHDRPTLPGRRTTRGPAARGYVRATAGATIAVGTCCASSVSWSPDGQRLAVGVADTLHLVRRTGSPLATLSFHGHVVTSVAWSPDGRTLAVGCRDGSVRVYGATGRLRATLTGHTGAVTSVAWSVDGQLVASGSADGTVRIWQTNDELLTIVFGDAQPVQSVSWSPLLQLPNGRMVAIAAGHEVRLEWLDGTVRFTLSHLGATTSVAWSPSGHTIAIGSQDKQVRLLNPIGRLSATLKGHTAAVTSVAWSPNSTMLASGSLDKTVRVWGARGQVLARLTGQRGGIYSVAWSPDGKTLASAGWDGTVRLWTIR